MAYSTDEYIAHYDKHYSTRDKSASGTGEYEIKLQMWYDLGYKDTMTVLDYGCGWGAMLPGIKDHSKYVGVDISENAIEMGKEYFPEATFKVMYPGKLKLNKKFDFIPAQSVFTHTPKHTVLDCLSDIKSHLKTDGIALIDILIGNDNESDPHVRYYQDEPEWLGCIVKAGLRAKFVKTIQWPGGLHFYYEVRHGK